MPRAATTDFSIKCIFISAMCNEALPDEQFIFGLITDLYFVAHKHKLFISNLSKSHNDFVAILDLPEGEHQYKFFVDGQWVHDPSEVLCSITLNT